MVEEEDLTISIRELQDMATRDSTITEMSLVRTEMLMPSEDSVETKDLEEIRVDSITTDISNKDTFLSVGTELNGFFVSKSLK